MSNHLVEIYYQMPPQLRSLAASARGYYLRWWRYGSETERLVQEALEREHWSAARWKTWQEDRLARVLHRAATQVPYYRAQWAERRRGGDRTSWEYLENWPILTKTALRADARAFVAEDHAGDRLLEEHTSGTTGTPIRLWFTREALHSWYALFEARWRRWYGVSLKDKWAILGGQMVAPFNQAKPPFWVWNAGLNQLYMSVLHLRPDCVRHYLRAITDHAVAYLLGYSSSLYWLAMGALEYGVELPIKVVLTDAEPLLPWQRQVLSNAFQCPVRETYGLAEMVSGASECEYNSMHLWPEAGYSEILDEQDHPVPTGGRGRLVATGFLNDAMPLVRYQTGDLLQLASSEAVCSCQRRLPLVEKLLGRLGDYISTRDGRRIGLVDIIFEPNLHMLEAQIIQQDIDRLTIRVVPDTGWCEADEDSIRVSLLQRVGDMHVVVEAVPSIERTNSGKYKVIVSKMACEVDGH